MSWEVRHGDCLDVLRAMPDASVGAIVTDPPYALPGGFMGKQWDNHDGREDSGFGYWLAGFSDGEGCFRVQRHERGTHTCAFQIKLRRDDKGTLERIRRFVGHGTVRDVEGDGSSSPQAAYVVQDRDGCEALVGLFRKYPLTAKKANDFEVWAEAVHEWLERPRGNRWHGQADQTRASALKDRLENVRRYTDIPWSGHRFQDWCRQWGSECLRVLKPGGHMLAFGAPRQYHRLACGIEDAGFEVRDCIGWLFGSGFPKSHNLTGEWAGWGTALKPAWESIVVARKPLDGTVAANVQEWGTGAMNIEGCRVPGTDHAAAWDRPVSTNIGAGSYISDGTQHTVDISANKPSGRWPANLIHDGSEEVVRGFPNAKGSALGTKYRGPKFDGDVYNASTTPQIEFGYGDSGSAARFFYCAKASKADRNSGGVNSHHPTVKPTDLMRYLCRLVTPPGGTVLDPFTGSGSTGKAAILEGFNFIGIEREAEYVEIARARIAQAESKHSETLVAHAV